jgi:hypothetical protein
MELLNQQSSFWGLCAAWPDPNEELPSLDRTWRGTDHAASSLEPDGLRRFVRDLDAVRKAFRYRDEDVLSIEAPQRKELKRSACVVPGETR